MYEYLIDPNPSQSTLGTLCTKSGLELEIRACFLGFLTCIQKLQHNHDIRKDAKLPHLGVFVNFLSLQEHPKNNKHPCASNNPICKQLGFCGKIWAALPRRAQNPIFWP